MKLSKVSQATDVAINRLTSCITRNFKEACFTVLHSSTAPSEFTNRGSLGCTRWNNRVFYWAQETAIYPFSSIKLKTPQRSSGWEKPAKWDQIAQGLVLQCIQQRLDLHWHPCQHGITLRGKEFSSCLSSMFLDLCLLPLLSLCTFKRVMEKAELGGTHMDHQVWFGLLCALMRGRGTQQWIVLNTFSSSC